MIKRVPSRNPRSKGVRVKHVLQICLLLGVCFWLIYQVKRSHDKKKEFDKNEEKGMINGYGIPKLGRKDLPHEPVLTKNDKQDDDEDDEVGLVEEIPKDDDDKLEQGQEEEGMKHREEEEDEDEDIDGESKLRVKETEEIAVHKEEERGHESKSEEEEEEDPEEDSKKEQMKVDNDDTGVGDDDIDEHDQDKIEGEADPDEEPRDEDKDAQEGEEEENDVSEREDQVHPDHETSVEDQDLDGGDKGLHEAREEIYKADDASSAVTHDTRTLSTESENVKQDHSDKNSAMTDSETMTAITTSGTEGVLGDHDQGNTQPLNMIPTDDEKLLANSSYQLVRGNTNTSAEVNVEGGGASKGNNTVSSDISQHDGSEINLDSQSHEGKANSSSTGDSTKLNANAFEQENSKIGADGEQQDPGKDSTNPTAHLESYASRINIKPEVTAEGEGNSGLPSGGHTEDDTRSNVPVLAIDVTKDAILSDKAPLTGNNTADATHSDDTQSNVPVLASNTSDHTEDAAHNDNPEKTPEFRGADENLGDSNADSKGENEDHSADSEISQDEKESRLDLGTLPESSSDAVNDRNAAAE